MLATSAALAVVALKRHTTLEANGLPVLCSSPTAAATPSRSKQLTSSNSRSASEKRISLGRLLTVTKRYSGPLLPLSFETLREKRRLRGGRGEVDFIC